MVQQALIAADTLAAQGKQAMVIDMAAIKPLDEDLVVAAAKQTGFVVTAEEHSVIGGLGSAVAETLSRRHPTRQAYVASMIVSANRARPENSCRNTPYGRGHRQGLPFGLIFSMIKSGGPRCAKLKKGNMNT